MTSWRKGVEERQGTFCAAQDEISPCLGRLECHHVIYRSRGGKDVTENGLLLCQAHHMRVHARTTLIRIRWLTPETRRFLAYHSYVDWDEEGQAFGSGWKGFAPLQDRDRTAMVSTRWQPPQRRS